MVRKSRQHRDLETHLTDGSLFPGGSFRPTYLHIHRPRSNDATLFRLRADSSTFSRVARLTVSTGGASRRLVGEAVRPAGGHLPPARAEPHRTIGAGAVRDWEENPCKRLSLDDLQTLSCGFISIHWFVDLHTLLVLASHHNPST
jgi:hypothetical protein